MTTTLDTIFPLPDARVLRYRLSHPDESSRPTVILAGMLATTAPVWDRVAAALHAAGFRTLAYDPPGHGGSSPPPVLASNTFAAMADDAYRMVTTICRNEAKAEPSETPALAAPVYWIGCSLGAATGVVFAARHPGVLHRLVVCDTVSQSPHVTGSPDAFSPRVQAARAAGSLDDTLAGARSRWLGDAWLARPEHAAAARALADAMAPTTLDGYEACIAALLAPDFDLSQQAPKVAAALVSPSKKALILVGENDAPLPVSMKTLAEQIRAGLVASTGVSAAEAEEAVPYVVIPNAGHASFIDGFDNWCAAVLPFLQSPE